MKYVWHNLLRNKKVTLSSALAVAALAVFLLVFANSIQIYQEELIDICSTLVVKAHVEGDKAGSLASMSGELRQSILNSGFVANHTSKARSQSESKLYLMGLQTVKGDDTIEEEALYADWLEGYDAELFAGAEQVCVLPRSMGHALGEQVEIVLERNTEVAETFLVAGLYGAEYVDDRENRTIYCPLATMEILFSKNNLELTYCRMDMELCNLQNLIDFKREMLKLELDKGKSRLVINDYIMQEVTGQLKQQINLLQSLLPVLFSLVTGIGFGLSFLLLRGRKKEAAIMRSLGMSRARVFLLLLMENLCHALIGCVLGSLIVIFSFGPHAFQFPYLLVLLVCYLLGGAAAIWKLSGVNVFITMTAKE